MAIRGQRFHLDLDSDEEITQQSNGDRPTTARNPWSLVSDIQERSPSTTARPPSPPKIKSSQSGFPAHTKKYNPSVFKQGTAQSLANHRGTQQSEPQRFASQNEASEVETKESWEKQEINAENKQRIAEMSLEDVDEAKQELMASLSPSLIERLLRRANIDDMDQGRRTELDDEQSAATKSSKKMVADQDPISYSVDLEAATPSSRFEDMRIERHPDLQPVATFTEYPAPPPIDSPRPPTPPSLDPEDPEFLSKLHSTYFPSLPSNPNALSWMQPPDPVESEAYSPSSENLLPSAVRFDFRGRLLPPRLAAQIPPTKGLHHHGTAPEAAGYTVPELAHLSRSSFPSQRCIAYQTLGRILYRLGTGVFGPEDHELCQGLWKCIEQGRVLDTLTAEAARDRDSGNRSCWVTATEAIWLWRKGGGRKWKAA
ncbi:MAG: hypothetical protein Q9201_002758 [Fulgogasparrea decipioides]